MRRFFIKITEDVDRSKSSRLDQMYHDMVYRQEYLVGYKGRKVPIKEGVTQEDYCKILNCEDYGYGFDNYETAKFFARSICHQRGLAKTYLKRDLRKDIEYVAEVVEIDVPDYSDYWDLWTK